MQLHLENVSKSYGNQLILNNLTLSLKKGEIIGFLGPNGAGKSTMMKILTGYILPNQGQVSVAGLNMLSKTSLAQRAIGYLPDKNPL